MSDTAVEFTVPAVTAAVAAAIPDRELIIQGDRRYSYAEIIERSHRLAAYLHSRGLGCHTERPALDGHEVGQDLVGLYAYNGNEFVESLLGAFAARVAPFNVNFRYVKSELQYLLADSGATALIYHAAFAPRVAEVLAGPSAAAGPDPDRRRLRQRVARRRRGLRDRDQLGGRRRQTSSTPPTTCMCCTPAAPPACRKACLWRQHDIFMTSFGGRNLMTGEPTDSLDQIVARLGGSTGNQADDPAAADSRRGAVERDDGDHDRPDRRIPHCRRPFGRRRRGPHHRARESHDCDGGRRRDGAAVGRRHREGHRRRVVAGRGGQRRRAADAVRQAAR